VAQPRALLSTRPANRPMSPAMPVIRIMARP